MIVEKSHNFVLPISVLKVQNTKRSRDELILSQLWHQLVNLFCYDGFFIENYLAKVVKRCFNEQMQGQRADNYSRELFYVVL